MGIKEIILATKNKGKVKEFKQMLMGSGLDYEVLSLLDLTSFPTIIEDGLSFQENAFKKAEAVCVKTGLLTIADDSGLEVDYLDGAPGIHSARFFGVHADDQKNNAKLLHLLRGVPKDKRTARFRCVICIMPPTLEAYYTEGVCEGLIGEKPRGNNGFGFDPLFYLPQYQQTMAELDPKVKNKISHRAVAFKKAIEVLTSCY